MPMTVDIDSYQWVDIHSSAPQLHISINMTLPSLTTDPTILPWLHNRTLVVHLEPIWVHYGEFPFLPLCFADLPHLPLPVTAQIFAYCQNQQDGKFEFWLGVELPTLDEQPQVMPWLRTSRFVYFRMRARQTKVRYPAHAPSPPAAPSTASAS